MSVIYGSYVVLRADTTGPGLNVNVALPLDAVYNSSDILSQIEGLNNVTKSFTVTVWWGLVENTNPGEYDWQAYANLFNLILAASPGAKIKAEIAFHACKNDDFCDAVIPLPSWIQAMAILNPDIFYTDASGYSSQEYLSSGVDYVPIFAPSNRTAVQVYSSFIQSFLSTFSDMLDSTIYEIQIGLGPAGELRYPAFPADKWALPGIGQFQSYDKYLKLEYATYANKSGVPQFSNLPEVDAVYYNDVPAEASFFNHTKNGNSNSTSEYGAFFLQWYSNRLIQHGSAILSQAQAMVSIYSPNVILATRLGCIFWLSQDNSRASELVAGYSSYQNITQMLHKYNVVVEIPCFDLTDKTVQKLYSKVASPEAIVSAVFNAAQSTGTSMEGTNSILDNYSTFDRIESNCRKDISTVTGFNIRYLSPSLFEKLREFREFYDAMTHPNKLHK